MVIDIYSKDVITTRLNSGFPEKTVIISFYDSMESKVDSLVDYARKNNRVFFVAIQDIDIEELSEFGMTYDTYFPEVSELAEFIYRAYNKGFRIICQCEHGQSRSAGCAAAILEHFCHNGITVFSDYRYYPNKLIFHKVSNALDDYRKI